MNHTAQMNGVYPCEAVSGGEAVSWDAYMAEAVRYAPPIRSGRPQVPPLHDEQRPCREPRRTGAHHGTGTNGGMIYNPQLTRRCS